MKSSRKRNSTDKIWVGFILGILVPIILFLIFYQVEGGGIGFSDYLANIWHMRVLMKILSLCVVPNLAFFLLFYHNKYDMAARGVILATFFYAFAVVVTKLV